MRRIVLAIVASSPLLLEINVAAVQMAPPLPAASPTSSPSGKSPLPIGSTAKAVSGLTKEAADAFAVKLKTLESYEKNAKLKRINTTVFENELNSYVNITLRDDLPPGLSKLRATLRNGRVEFRGMADLARFADVAGAAGSGSLLALLGGEMSVEVVANFKSADGFGTLEVVSAQLGPMPLSPSVLTEAVAKATKSKTNPEGFNLGSPFRLPYRSKRIRATEGAAIVEY